MSFETQITQLVATLTSRLNEITNQAKKIFELDWQNPLITSSEIHVSNAGTSQKINVQQIIDAAVSFRQNQLISVGDITVSGNTVTVPSGAKWIIDNVNYETITDTVINIPFATAGYNRKDILVAGKEGTIYVVQGFESEEISVPRNPPIDTVLVTTIDIDDSSVGDPSDPSYGTDFVEKRESVTFYINTSVAVTDIIHVLDQRSFLSITGVATDIKSVAINVSYLRDGKPFFIKNNTNHDIKIWHNAALMTNHKFYFPNAQDFILKPTQIIEFAYNMSIGTLEFIGSATQLNTTDALPEGLTNLYFTNPRVLATALTGLSVSTGSAIISTDTVLISLGKIQKQLNDINASKQDISNQIEVTLPATVLSTWNGKTVLFTSTGTLTVPSTLADSFIFNGITLTGVTLSWAITSPKTWLFITPSPIIEKQIFTFTQRGATDSIMILPVQ